MDTNSSYIKQILKSRVIILFFLFVSIFQYTGCASDAGSLSPTKNDMAMDTNAGLPVDFYSQCRDVRCDFKMMEGDEIEHGVATWHPNDTGINLIGKKVVLSSTDEWAGSPDVPVNCYQISVLGYWDNDVTLSAQIDITYLEEDTDFKDTNSDSLAMDTSSYESPWERHNSLIPVNTSFKYIKEFKDGDWNLFKFNVMAPRQESFMTFSLIKEGDEDAILYFIEVDGMFNCDDIETVEVD
ncbi:MAG: hypothetical protein JXR91_00115 [Deltaproteobacteria bacterium]|nr:hypothetical protein [Deltaproteobacteria bacterium]